MESFHFFSKCILTMNSIGQFHVAYATRICPSTFRGSWKAPMTLLPCIGTMKPLTAWSPGFSRSKPFEPPEGGTPNQPRLVESLHDFDAPHRDDEPTPNTSQEGT